MKAQIRKRKKRKGILVRQAEGKLITKQEQNFVNRRTRKKNLIAIEALQKQAQDMGLYN
jgi:hypothetical protein